MEINIIWAIAIYIATSISIYLYLEWIEDNREVFKSIIISSLWGLVILLPLVLLGIAIYSLYKHRLAYWLATTGLIIIPPNLTESEIRNLRALLWDLKNERKTLYQKYRFIACKKVARQNNVDINTITEKDADCWSTYRGSVKYDC